MSPHEPLGLYVSLFLGEVVFLVDRYIDFGTRPPDCAFDLPADFGQVIKSSGHQFPYFISKMEILMHHPESCDECPVNLSVLAIIKL